MAVVDKPEDLLAAYYVIDADAHYTEPPDFWTSRAPASMKDRVPHVKRVDGVDHWFIEGDQDFGPLGYSTVDKDRVKHLGADFLSTFDSIDRAAYDPQAKLELMDSLGLWAQVLYPNAGGVSSTKFLAEVSDPDLRLACVKTYNDGLAQMHHESGGRLLGQALVPVWDRDEMEKEVRRAIEDLGLSGIVISDKPESLGLPSFNMDYWAGFWEYCSTTSTPVDFHIAGNEASSRTRDWKWETFGPETAIAFWSCMLYLANAATVANFCLSGIFDKYPGLKLVSVESGMGWIPFLLDAMEYQFDEEMPNEKKALQRRPREYFRDHFYATFWFEGYNPSVIEAIGPRNVMIETDFPHPTCLFPHQEHIAAAVKDYSPEVRRRLLQDNAAELYKVKLPTVAAG